MVTNMNPRIKSQKEYLIENLDNDVIDQDFDSLYEDYLTEQADLYRDMMKEVMYDD